jgi:hypothetical protein
MQIIVLFLIYSATITSAVLLPFAVHSGKHGWAYLSAVLASPICLFVAGYPSTFYIPVLFPLGIWLGALCIKKGRTSLALLFFSPYIILWIGVVITVLVN